MHYYSHMSPSKKPARVSILPPPDVKGAFKMQTVDGVTLATPSKSGKLDNTPSHACNSETRKWVHIEESASRSLFRETGTSSPPGKPATSNISNPDPKTDLVPTKSSSVPKAPGYNIKSLKTYHTRTPTPPPSAATAAANKRTASAGPPYAAAGTVPPAAHEHPVHGSIAASSPAHHVAGQSNTAPTTPPAADMMKIIEMLMKKESNKDHEADGCINVPNYKSKRGRELHDKASAGISVAQRYILNQVNSLNYLRLVRRTSNTCHWGSVLNKTPTSDGLHSILFNNRSITLEEVTKEARNCWGPSDNVCSTNDETIMQERTIRMIIGNWVKNTLIETDLIRFDPI